MNEQSTKLSVVVPRRQAPWKRNDRVAVSCRPTGAGPVETSHTLTAAMQMFCAQAALFFFLMPAIKPLGVSLTVADLFLIPAVFLNIGFALRLHFFQFLLLLALPLNLLSHMLDPGGELIPMLQMVYLWGFLVPFGWCAFVTVPKERLALLLLIGASLSSVRII